MGTPGVLFQTVCPGRQKIESSSSFTGNIRISRRYYSLSNFKTTTASKSQRRRFGAFWKRWIQTFLKSSTEKSATFYGVAEPFSGNFPKSTEVRTNGLSTIWHCTVWLPSLTMQRERLQALIFVLPKRRRATWLRLWVIFGNTEFPLRFTAIASSRKPCLPRIPPVRRNLDEPVPTQYRTDLYA